MCKVKFIILKHFLVISTVGNEHVGGGPRMLAADLLVKLGRRLHLYAF